MGKWFFQDREIRALRAKITELRTDIAIQEDIIRRFTTNLTPDLVDNPYGLNEEEIQILNSGRTIKAALHFRERTGCGTLVALNAVKAKTPEEKDEFSWPEL